MARRSLQNLLNKIESESSLKKEVRRLIDKRTHYYELDLHSLISEIEHELIGTFAKKSETRIALSPEQMAVINTAAAEYFRSVRDSMTKGTSTFNVEIISASQNYFQVRISSKNNKASVFESFINANRRAPLERLRQRLISDMPNSSDMKGRLDILLQTGHQVGSSIAEQRTKNYLRSFDTRVRNIKAKLPKGVKYQDTPMYRLEALVNAKDTRLDRVRQVISIKDVYVTEQGRESNREQGIEEKRIIDSIRGKIKNALAKEDWTEFESSTPPKGRIANKILETAVKRGATISRSNTKNIVPRNVKAKSGGQKGKRINTSSTDNIDLLNVKTVGEERGQQSALNWNRILPIINAKLPPRVIAHMRFPGLVNRTGEFASSAKVLFIEQTRQGYPSFVFDYERDPYDVFDRTVGRAPWNTPQRDPQALVDKSLREVVREMAIGRFYTRRA